MVKEKPSRTTRPSKPVQPRTTAPALNPDSREKQMINKAVALAERQLEDGTASAAVITHYLKLGTEREKMERDILSRQAKLLEAKATSIEQAKDNENLAKEAVDAMKSYGPSQ